MSPGLAIELLCWGMTDMYLHSGGMGQAIVAALSAGSFRIADPVGRTNLTVVSGTCRGDGVLLKPDQVKILIVYTNVQRCLINARIVDITWSVLSSPSSSFVDIPHFPSSSHHLVTLFLLPVTACDGHRRHFPGGRSPGRGVEHTYYCMGTPMDLCLCRRPERTFRIAAIARGSSSTSHPWRSLVLLVLVRHFELLPHQAVQRQGAMDHSCRSDRSRVWPHWFCSVHHCGRSPRVGRLDIAGRSDLTRSFLHGPHHRRPSSFVFGASPDDNTGVVCHHAEPRKYVPVSAQRFQAVRGIGEGMGMRLLGAPGETIQIAVKNDREIMLVSCTVPSTQDWVTLTVNSNGHTCAPVAH